MEEEIKKRIDIIMIYYILICLSGLFMLIDGGLK